MSKSILKLVNSGVEVKIALGREEIEKMEREMAAESKQVKLQPKKQGKQVKEVIKEKTVKVVKSDKPVKKVKKAEKYYAIKEAGKIKNVIYTDWKKVKGILTGCIAVYKSFETEEEAKAYLKSNIDLEKQKNKIRWCMSKKDKNKDNKDKDNNRSNRRNKKKSKKKENMFVVSKINKKKKKNKKKSYNNSNSNRYDEPVVVDRYNSFDENNIEITGEMAEQFESIETNRPKFKSELVDIDELMKELSFKDEEDDDDEEFELDAEMKEIFDRIDNRQFDGLFDKFKNS